MSSCLRQDDGVFSGKLALDTAPKRRTHRPLVGPDGGDIPIKKQDAFSEISSQVKPITASCPRISCGNQGSIEIDGRVAAIEDIADDIEPSSRRRAACGEVVPCVEIGLLG